MAVHIIRARILSLDWSKCPMCRLILTRKQGNVIYVLILKKLMKDIPVGILTSAQ